MIWMRRVRVRHKNGSVVDKVQGCDWDVKGRRYRPRNVKKIVEWKLGKAQLSFFDMFWKPFRFGLASIRVPDVVDHVRKTMKAFDVVIVHSCGHDLGKRKGSARKIAIIGSYRQHLPALARVAREFPMTRLVWLSCDGQAGTKHVTSKPFFKRLQNRAARTILGKLLSASFCDVFTALNSAEVQPLWWATENGVPTGNIHTHEQDCPLVGNGTFPRLGGKGYMSKVKTQLLFGHVCAVLHQA